MDLVQKKIKVSDDADEADASSEAAANVSESTDVELDSHPLLAHLRLYIFSDVYLGSELKQLAVISVMRVASLKIQPSDSLLDWLAHYAAYTVDQLSSSALFSRTS
jgi:hypothetical protein